MRRHFPTNRRRAACTAMAALLVSVASAGWCEVRAGEPGRQVSFVNDVLPVLSKIGCNQGTCHGGAAGKGGFKLSLRGFAPELDHLAIVREASARRVDLLRPEASLLLAKPTMAVPHQGGRVLSVGSPEYQIVAEWLRQGAHGPNPGDPRPVALAMVASTASARPGEWIELRVAASFSDGQVRDVTRWARYDTNESAVATVDADGVASAVGPGKAALSAVYQDQVAAVELSVPYPAAGQGEPRDYALLPRNNYIDEHVVEQWRALRLWPSPLADDATFLRRVYLDLIGTLPTPGEVRAFLADQDPRKREAAIDRLLERPEFVDLWAQRWGDVLRVSREWLGEKSMWTFHAWLRDRIARNVSWNEVVRDLVAGAGDSSREGPPNYYRLQKVFNEPELWPLTAAETTAQTFLGVRVQCARCHNHPFDRWTQADYYGLAGFFAQVGSKSLGDKHVVVFDARQGEIVHPRLGRALAPKLLDGPAMAIDADDVDQVDRRRLLADWIASRDNPYLARVTANRIWRYLMGRGLVEPVDDLRESNPATNEPLLAALAADLVEHQFDLKHLMRSIARSRVYQLSSTPTDGNRDDDRFYSFYRPKRLSAEQILDALGQVTGQMEKFEGLPEGFKALQLPDTRVPSKFLDMFGRPLRRVASCECERVAEPNLGQALELLNSSMLDQRVTADGSLVNRLLSQAMDDRTVLDEIYLGAVGRMPTMTEAEALLAAMEPPSASDAGGGSQAEAVPRREFFEDVLWALLNSKEFLFNH